VQQANVQAYETTMLKNASTVLNAANLQFQNGEINYLEWVMLTNQAVSIQSGYIDAVQNLNRIQIQLQTLSGNQ
jgi:heavy metal efflux system protein